ncbi:MAG: ribosome maturation factor RimM [Longimicrobiaceae bacterium]
MTEDPPAYLLVGSVRKPHGVKGEVFIWLETDRPDSVFRPGRKLWRARGPDDSLPGEAVTVASARLFKGGVLVRFAGHAGREAAEGLRGSLLLMEASQAEPPVGSEVPYHRFIGMEVRVGGERIGEVTGVRELGYADAAEVRALDGRELLIPLVAEMVVRADPGEGVLELDPPEGLLEL